MTPDEAKRLLLLHSFALDELDNPQMTSGFLGSLRPYKGLREENFHEVMAALRVVAPRLGQPQVDREIMAALWNICHLAHAWGVQPEGMLRRNALILPADVERLENWIEAITYATMISLDNAEGGDSEDEAFSIYEGLRGNLKLLAISGSLRASSSNGEILHALMMLAPADVNVEIYENMGALPHFNPDDDDSDDNGETAPSSVLDLRARVRAADGLLICTPEYVHGLPGSFKNLLDWLVSGGELWDKPVAIVGVAGRGQFANASLREILKTLMAKVSEKASVEIPLGSNKTNWATLMSDSEIAALLRGCVESLAGEIGG